MLYKFNILFVMEGIVFVLRMAYVIFLFSSLAPSYIFVYLICSKEYLSLDGLVERSVYPIRYFKFYRDPCVIFFIINPNSSHQGIN